MYKNKTASLDDVFDVGSNKPVGYKLINDLTNLSHISPGVIAWRVVAKGQKSLQLTGNDCAMNGGAIYVWDDNALKKHLEANKQTLTDGGWPTSTEAFIRKLAIDWAPEKTELYDVIADAFGDADNPGRTDKIAADSKGLYRDEYIEYLTKLENGEDPAIAQRPSLNP